ncbi:MAG: RNA pyrophosphohydrolase [Deltaproteobacteria bacterium]|nr:RNA pyrophosphohydrolase [Deltaproteobacteria bacterium]
MGLPAQYFRAGVGAVIVNARGLALVLERADIPGAWQLPQGGLESSEDPLQAAFREIAEETGIMKSDLELLAVCPDLLAYELPPGARTAKTGRGQAQYWFLFRFRGLDSTIDVESGGEFRCWQWMPLQSLLNVAADFRKPVYHRLVQQFQGYAANS